MLQPLRDLPLLRDTYQEGRSDGQAEGKAEGQALGVLMLLDERGIPLSEEQRQDILSCRDLPRLALWFKRALRASSLEEVLAPA